MAPDRRTVLVVDDEASIRLLCRVNLELEGYDVLEAATVAEASTLLASEQVDVVLLDIHVGSASGLDVLDEIRTLELPTRVVLLSGTAEVGPQLRERVDGVLGKPFALDQLVDAVSDDASGRLRGA